MRRRLPIIKDYPYPAGITGRGRNIYLRKYLIGIEVMVIMSIKNELRKKKIECPRCWIKLEFKRKWF